MSNLWLRSRPSARLCKRVVLIDTNQTQLQFKFSSAASCQLADGSHLRFGVDGALDTFSRPPARLDFHSLHCSVSSCSLRAADFMRIASTSTGSRPNSRLMGTAAYRCPPSSDLRPAASLTSPKRKKVEAECITYNIKQWQTYKTDRSPKSNRR